MLPHGLFTVKAGLTGPCRHTTPRSAQHEKVDSLTTIPNSRSSHAISQRWHCELDQKLLISSTNYPSSPLRPWINRLKLAPATASSPGRHKSPGARPWGPNPRQTQHPGPAKAVGGGAGRPRQRRSQFCRLTPDAAASRDGRRARKSAAQTPGTQHAPTSSRISPWCRHQKCHHYELPAEQVEQGLPYRWRRHRRRQREREGAGDFGPGKLGCSLPRMHGRLHTSSRRALPAASLSLHAHLNLSFSLQLPGLQDAPGTAAQLCRAAEHPLHPLCS